MNVPKIDTAPTLTQRVHQLRTKTTQCILSGDFQAARDAHKELVKISINNFIFVTKVPEAEEITFSLFSKEGWNAIKFSISEIFRRKTPEEKTLKKLHELYESGEMML